jgi:hypothetical protein
MAVTITPNPQTPPTPDTPAEASFIAGVTAEFGPMQGAFAAFIVDEVHIGKDFAALDKDLSATSGNGVAQPDFNQLFADTTAALGHLNDSGKSTDPTQVWKAQVITYAGEHQYLYGASAGFDTNYSTILMNDATATSNALFNQVIT